MLPWAWRSTRMIILYGRTSARLYYAVLRNDLVYVELRKFTIIASHFRLTLN